ncbi:hypothetical protein EYB45_09575 [Erythrobacteraceae bacterium CFH 75059]|uniref:hypothetical protein n=1 Tax=Qipengyuania thermophila TaxID=2509361 RepID=UPI00102172F5|nr:hypothetical protein [Qipengyuania thermophila]TCD02223.1 hypothetical protein EYB45_09575 [Erythrobacteraceae bacterium CFH 75059]
MTAVLISALTALLCLAFLLPREADPEVIGEWPGLALLALLAALVLSAFMLPSAVACLTRQEQLHENGWRDLADRFVPISVWLAVAYLVLF